MALHCDIVVRDSRVRFECDANFIGNEPARLRETLEEKLDLDAIPDGKHIGTVTFPSEPDGNTSFTLHEEYKQHLY